jgi:hypothetical protein
MNLRTRLQTIAHALSADRMTGKTTLLCRAAKELDAVVLAATFDQVNHLQRNHGVVAKSIDTNLQGLNGPFFIDHYATSKLLIRAADHIETLEKSNEKLQQEIEELRISLELLTQNNRSGAV